MLRNRESAKPLLRRRTPATPRRSRCRRNHLLFVLVVCLLDHHALHEIGSCDIEMNAGCDTSDKRVGKRNEAERRIFKSFRFYTMRQSSMRSLLSNSSSNGANKWSVATQMGQIRVTKEFFQKLHVVEAGSPRLFRVSRQKLLLPLEQQTGGHY